MKAFDIETIPNEAKMAQIEKKCPECDALWDLEHNRCSANCQSIEGIGYE